MPRILAVGAVGLICLVVASQAGFGQDAERRAPDRRLDDALADIAALKRTIADQDRRIAGLERTVKALQNPAPPPVISSRSAAGWDAVKPGMSRVQVEDILGPPTTADGVIDRQTLTYKGNEAEPIGIVILVGDRVTQVDSNRFKIHATAQK